MLSFWIATTLVWVLISYVIISFIEFFAHGVLMHKPTFLAKRFPFFKNVLDSHRHFHHGECFPGTHFDEAEGDCLEINIKLGVAEGQLLSFWIWGPLFLTALFFGLSSVVGKVLVLGALVFMLSLFAHHCIWNLIHIQMHTKDSERAKWFKQSRLCLWLARNHFMHHAYPRVNFCIVCPLADWLMGTYKAPQPKDIAEMRKHGFFPTEDN